MVHPRDLADLIALGDRHSLSAAAKQRGIAVSTLSRRIEALEAALGLKLVDRRTDGVRLTPHGKAVADAAQPLSQQLGRVMRMVEALRVDSRNPAIRVSATEFVVSDVLAPNLKGLLHAVPGLRLHLDVSADIVSLAARDADIAIRMTRPQGASLYARALPEIQSAFFAERSYVAGRDPAAIDLATEELLVYDRSYGPIPELQWLAENGLDSAICFTTASTRALLTAVQSGAGIGLLPRAFGLAEADFVEINPPKPLPVRRPWLVVHRDIRHRKDIRKVQQWCVSCFQKRFIRMP